MLNISEGFGPKLGEECGVFGIYDPNDQWCSHTVYYGLYALQHRGQESCGIAVNSERVFNYYKDMGLVNEVFDNEILNKLKGNMAIGHVRYSTAGASMRENAQPLVLRYVKGSLAIAHNGNLVNSNQLKTEFERTGAIYQTGVDTEIMAHVIARERLQCGSIEMAINFAMKKFIGAYSMVIMSPKKLIAVRDPWGFRPLCMGRRGEAIVFASETCALDAVGAKFERDVEPGEIIVVENGEIRTIRDHCGGDSHICIFEYIYFARPDSVVEGQGVYEARKAAGRLLAMEHPVDADVVTGVPDSGLPAAVGYAESSGINYETAFVKNRYIGRTFIQPNQESRETSVRIKLNALKSSVEGKRIVMIDDSIVRGTTSGRIVRILREAGAKEVHVRISSPPFLWPCYFGTDIPEREQLVACHHSIDEIRGMIGADTLGYLSIENLAKIAPDAKCGFCTSCFTGQYPVEII